MISVEIIVSATANSLSLSLSPSISLVVGISALFHFALPREGGFVNLDSSIKREESTLGGSLKLRECSLSQVQENVGYRFGKFAKPPRAISLAVGGCSKSTG